MFLQHAFRINKDKKLSREFTQRSRSFLYAALGATIAQLLGLSRIRFYENGIVSLNLPPSPQVVGARATRTTHPQVINGFSEILSRLIGKKFTVENPFLWSTRADILRIIEEAGCCELIKFTTSCMHTRDMTKLITHCGTCSQCIDRRFSILATDLDKYDPEEAYKVDLLLGERENEIHQTMLASYVEMATEITHMKPTDFFSRYGEASRALRHIEGSADSTAIKIFEMHKKHALLVTSVIDEAIAKHASAIRERKIPSTCLLRMVCDSLSLGLSQEKVHEVGIGDQAEPKKLGDYVFKRKGQVWQVRFAGGAEFILLPSKGAAYLNVLLSSPGREFPVNEIVLQVAKEPELYALGDPGESSDHQALVEYRVKLEDLRDELEEAKDNNDWARQEKIENDIYYLSEQLQ